MGRLRSGFKVFIILIVLGLFLSSCSIRGGDSQGSTDPAPRDFTSSRISYLGPEGTYTQEALEKFCGKVSEQIPCKTVEDAVDLLVSGESDYAVIPQENTIGGPVAEYIDTVISYHEVSVIGEVELTINQNLLTLPDAQLSDIKTVYSHKQGIAQGRQWLDDNLQDAEVIEVASTAEGAKMVADSKDKTCAAIASAGCADVYGLKVAAAAIQMNDKNITRFYILSTEPAPANAASKDSGRLAFIASGKAADLPGLMSALTKPGARLVAIHDRPGKTELGTYNYLIECEGLKYPEYQKITSSAQGFEFRFLGCFDKI